MVGINKNICSGNGVENAYNFTPKVFTLSFHKYETGFFPGTGSLEDVGIGRGKFHAVNVPLKEGLCNTSFCSLFKWLVNFYYENYSDMSVNTEF